MWLAESEPQLTFDFLSFFRGAVRRRESEIREAQLWPNAQILINFVGNSTVHPYTG